MIHGACPEERGPEYPRPVPFPVAGRTSLGIIPMERPSKAEERWRTWKSAKEDLTLHPGDPLNWDSHTLFCFKPEVLLSFDSTNLPVH